MKDIGDIGICRGIVGTIDGIGGCMGPRMYRNMGHRGHSGAQEEA